ncbi:hypothetical protein R3P38DRAFT_188964 [Favolaschia claudopus]|uniref:F-box domain-containing protein n=1 Tax=Favolaschia claudopus TaxID=2862362 RepID=A0AAW0D2Q6_9AGAR
MAAVNDVHTVPPVIRPEGFEEEVEEEGDEEEEEEEEEEWESDEGSFDDGEDDDSDAASSVSSTIPRSTLAPMPEHLTLPVELHRRIIGHSNSSSYHEIWGTSRLVSKGWKSDVEHLAKMHWIRESSFEYPGEMIWDQKIGKVFLNGDFSFQRLEGDIAHYAITDCAPEFRKALVRVCKTSRAPPDVQVGEIVHDVEIPGMQVDWDTLTLTCPWRPLIARLMAEELRVEAQRATGYTDLWKFAKTAKKRNGGESADMESIGQMLKMFGNNFKDAYVAVRRKRMGYADKEGDERLKSKRFVASLAGVDDVDEDE